MATISEFNKTPGTSSDSNIRFVASLDILGFTQLVETKPLSWLIGKFEEVISQCLQNSTRPQIQLKDQKQHFELCKYIRFSDTVIFYSMDDSEKSLFHIVESVNLFIWYSLANGIPIRGAISKGELYIGDAARGESFVGRALVDAYKLERDQDWCGAVIDLSIWNDKKYNYTTNYLRNGHRVIMYKAPFKHGEVNMWPCIEWPVYYIGGFKDAEPKLSDLFLDNHASPLTWDIERKIQNTKTFLEHCRHADQLPTD